jgi:hypothetical protein
MVSPDSSQIAVQLQIHPPVVVHEEYVVAVVAALRDMVGESNGYGSG